MRFEITDPCEESWDAMEPREGGRYCGRCEKVVIDLAAMSRAQAEAKIRSLDATEVCVQLNVDRFGDAVFQRPAPSLAPHWAAGLVLVTALTGAHACAVPAPECLVKTATLEPDPGPAMIPTDPTTFASVAPLPATGPVPAEQLATADGAAPTAEQRALTAAKHRPPPIVHAIRGRMPISHSSSWGGY